MQASAKPKFSKFGMVIFTLLGLFFATSAHALTCHEVRQLTAHYLRLHHSYNNFDDELSRRTLDSFVKAWDPGKVYFLAADIEVFKNKYATRLDDMINAANCSAIEFIANTYSKRFRERQVQINKLIAKKYDFTKEEFLTIDRKKLRFAKTTEELTERWRKRIKFQFLQLNGTIKDVKTVREKLVKRYKIATKRHNELTSDDLYGMFLDAFSNSLDPHSDYLPPEALEDFRIQTRLSLEGIGAVLRSEDGFTTIQSLVPGGAAYKTGKVEIDDKIVSVGEGEKPPVDVIDMDLREVVKLIRGPRGTEVRLSIVRQKGGEAKKIIVPIIREKVQLKDRAAKSYVFEVPVPKSKNKYHIGVIDLPSFYMDFEGRHARKANFKSSSVDMLKEIKKLKSGKKKVDAIIVDLRSNGGGSLEESIKVAGLFIDKGPVVQTKGINNTPYVQNDEDSRTHYDGPLLLLIDRQSASASEIFAGAIKDYERGLIVGDHHTFGKGTVQNLSDLSPRLGAIKVTISKFYRPSGASTQLKGVESDIMLPSVADSFEIGEKHYDYALEWEKIKPVRHRNYNMVQPYLAQLKQASDKRVKVSKGFQEVKDSIAKFDAKKEERSRVSLRQKTKEELVKEEKEKKKDEEEIKRDEFGNPLPDFSKDVYLKEALHIAVDYSRLLKRKKIIRLAEPKLISEQKKAIMITEDNKQKKDGKKEVGDPQLIKKK